jgi:hypothetical protein
MKFSHKRPWIWLLLVIYIVSYFLQSWFFVDFWKIFAENPIDRTNLVAVFVDKDIYASSKSDIEWYATQYIQQRISNSKALVMPINTENFKAIDLVRMLENIYFDGVKGKTSRLLWTILVWNIPLPVVQNNGFVYPTIFPYVDFEDQQFIYDAHQKFFVYNDNPRGQAEIRHWVINFWWDVAKYSHFFTKLKKYAEAPEDFVEPLMWYDDFIGMKSTFAHDMVPYYVNNFLFAEDIGYHRFSNLMLNYLKQIQNDAAISTISGLEEISKKAAAINPTLKNPELDAIMKEWAWSFDGLEPSVPTVMLLSFVKELVTIYNNLYPWVFLSTIKDNGQAAARRYKKSATDELVDGIESHLHKLTLKDSLALWDADKWISPIIVSFNDTMEKALDKKIADNKRYMTFPVITDYNHQNWEMRTKTILFIPKRWCERTVNDTYRNFYFGDYAKSIDTAQEFSAYRGTFRNLDTLSGVAIENPKYSSYNGKALGASNNLFATQVEANKGYNIMLAAQDYDIYEKNKIKERIELVCSKHFKILGIKIFCMTYKSVPIWELYESPQDFSLRWWGGASTLNLNPDLLSENPPQYVFNRYNYKSAILPIYDIGWSVDIPAEQKPAYSFEWVKPYSALIKIEDRYGVVDYNKYIKAGKEEQKYLRPDLRPYSVWKDGKDGNWELLGVQRIWETYDNFEFFHVWNKKTDEGASRVKTISVNSINHVRTWPGVLCNGQKELFSYDYKLIDSRIKSTSPTPEHINGTYEDEFAENSLFWEHYHYMKEELQRISQEQDKLKTLFAEARSKLTILRGLHNQINTDIWSLPNCVSSASQILSTREQSYKETFASLYTTVEQIESLLPGLSFWMILKYFDRVQEIEKLYDKKTQFLLPWSNELKQELSTITTKHSQLSSEYTSARSLYDAIKSQYTNGFNISVLPDKRTSTDWCTTCGEGTGAYICGCTTDYLVGCQDLDTLRISLEKLSKLLLSLEFVANENGVAEQKWPLISLKMTFEDFIGTDGFASDFSLVQSKISSIQTVDPAPAPVHKPGLNEWTADRPIDWPRKITFKGLWWDIVDFEYPNIYSVSVYKKVWPALKLKTINEIHQSIIDYLQEKAKEYNTLLAQQEQGRLAYYQSNSAAFDFLASVDSLASPNTRQTVYLPEAFFVDLLGEKNIIDLAEWLYYQTLPVYVKKQETTVDKDFEATRDMFDINRKIVYILSGYLTEHPDEWPLQTPEYRAKWYEVGYINSDREDYISSDELPKFIKQVRESKKPVDTFVDYSQMESDPLFVDTKRFCAIDSSYSEWVFDLTEKQWKGKMPWVNAVKCWWRTLGSSVKFDVTLEVWPSFWEFADSLNSQIDGWKNDMKVWKDSMKKLLDPKQPGADFAGDFSQYWKDTITISGNDPTLRPRIASASFELPTTRLLAGSQMPLGISAKDFSGHVVDRVMESYTVSVQTWYGEFVWWGIPGPVSMEFEDFETTVLVYEAPDFTAKTSVEFTFTWKDTSAKASIDVVPWSLEVTFLWKKVYANKKTLQPIDFRLVNIEKNYSNVPNIDVSLRAIDGLPLKAPFSIRSKNWLFTPGVISGVFVPVDSYLLDNQLQKVYLMPSFRSWEDEVIIEVPGLDPIVIPVIIRPGDPYRINLEILDTTIAIWEILSWTINVTDTRWNAIDRAAKIKFWSLWVLNFEQTIAVSDKPYRFSVKANGDNRWLSYIYALLDGVALDAHSPAYQKYVVQEQFIPKEKLNVLYFNLFWSDWGNFWQKDAIDPQYVPNLIANSEKLLAVTTQSLRPEILKKFAAIVSQQGQVINFSDREAAMIIASWSLIADIQDVWFVTLDTPSNVTLFSSKDPLASLKATSQSSLIFVQNDFFAGEQFEITDKTISFSGELIMDLQQWLLHTWISIKLSPKMNQWYSVWSLSYGDDELGSLYFSRKIPLDTRLVHLYSTAAFDKEIAFAEWTTNGEQWIWIIDLFWVFAKEWYLSIEDSYDYEQWIWFRADFKNITLFGDWKTVGEATIPFGSQFLINFWDPLISRISKNIEIDVVKQDLGIGEHLYSNASKSIFKVLNGDINNDGLEDVVVVFNNGSVKVLKNYWWSDPYTDMQDLMLLADSIEDIYLWDVDGNNYPDILVWTTNKRVKVYRNSKWVFAVDGNLVCLNVNAPSGSVSKNPDLVWEIQQIFFEDMDKDGIMDIVTNDAVGDIKAFYGGTTNGWGNYVSTLEYTCDDNWYDRQKNATVLVKSFGAEVDPSRYVQDDSMIHVNWWIISQQEPIEEDWAEENIPDMSILNQLSAGMDAKSFSMNIGNFLKETSTVMQDATSESLQEWYSVSPVPFVPSYESWYPLDEIWYKYLYQLSDDESVSAYKQYKDLNGWVLMSWDRVKITTTIVPLKWWKATYVDRILWPWEIQTDADYKILSFVKESWSFAMDDIKWMNSDEANFVIDNISLSQPVIFSYEVIYLGTTTVSIDVKDELLIDKWRKKDGYPDIVTAPLDSCKKYRWVFFNEKRRSFLEVFDNMQEKLDEYTKEWQEDSEELVQDTVPNPPAWMFKSSIKDWSDQGMDYVRSTLSGLGAQNIFEIWNVSDLFPEFSANPVNVTLDTDVLKKFTAPISEEIDKHLDGLCNGYKLGSTKWCQPPVPFNMIPFNQAFLAPGQYHLFGCFQDLLKPLNMTLGKWWPVLSVPGNRWPTPIGYIPAPNIFGFPFRSPMDGHLGWPQVGTYPSWVRLYLVPTLTLQMGIAICFWPYKVGALIPPLFRDLWGNCIVLSLPYPLKWMCDKQEKESPKDPTKPATEEVLQWQKNLSDNGACDQSVQEGSAVSLSRWKVTTYTAPFKLVSAKWTSWTQAVPQGNFWGFAYISFYPKTVKKSPGMPEYDSIWGSISFDKLKFIKWPEVNLKIRDSNAMWLVKKIVKDWFGRQVKFMVNNLTKMTITVTLPELAQMTDGFEWLFTSTAWGEASERAKEDDVMAFVDPSQVDWPLGKLRAVSSKQNYVAATSAVNNPFESLITLFESVPLVDLYTKDIIVKIPLPTSEELGKYDSYLRTWSKNQLTVLKQWLEAFSELAGVCWEMDPTQAKLDLDALEQEQAYINTLSDVATRERLFSSLEKERTLLEKIQNTSQQKKPLSYDDPKAVLDDINYQFTVYQQRVSAVPRLKEMQKQLQSKPSLTSQEQFLLNDISNKLTTFQSCATFLSEVGNFSSFYTRATSLIRDVQQNIQILDEYKRFPLQLYEWIHFVDIYMSQIITFISTLTSTLINWVGVNAKIYVKWVDALIMILTTIKTRQVLIDISVNWTKKCGKCSRDWYGAHSCSLWFLVPKIPIIPIPPFKIPNITIDLSHIDLWLSFALPRFVFVPVSFPMPRLPDLPVPPDLTLWEYLNFNLQFNFSVPEIPLLPSPPKLPELPSFIPNIDFSLPLLPPAPRIPKIIPEISAVIDVAEYVVKVFCILKRGFGLVWEKWVKTKVEQMTQRTRDVPFFDFFDQTFMWQTDPKPKWFDLQLDWYLQFRMDFSLFYDFLNAIAQELNSSTYKVVGAVSQGVDKVTSESNQITNFLQDITNPVDVNIVIPPLDVNVDIFASTENTLDYDTAYKQLMAGLQEITDRVDDPSIQKDVANIKSVLTKEIVVNPAIDQLNATHEQIQRILVQKQQEIRQLAQTVSSYDTFIAHVERNDIALVSDDVIDASFSSPLFVTDDQTLSFMKEQESPFKAYMDTNASLVKWYLDTVATSTPDDLRMTNEDYQRTSNYLEWMKSTIDGVYDTLWFEKISYNSCGLPYVAEDTSSVLLAQRPSSSLLAQTSAPASSSSSPSFATDISQYVNWVFVEDDETWTSYNVVKSQNHIDKVRDRYYETDINKDGKEDIVSWDDNSVYIKYANQDSDHQNARKYGSYYDISTIDSYEKLSNKADSEWYVDFWDISVKLYSPSQEVKNFRAFGQSFDTIKLSWMHHAMIGESADGYLVKVNNRFDTYNDKDLLLDKKVLDDEFLRKRYILVLPKGTDYTWASIDFKEKYYYKGNAYRQPRSVIDFLTWGKFSEIIYGVKFYETNQDKISIWINNIPRNWQYSEVIPLKNISSKPDKPHYVPQWPWSNQIVVGRQMLADDVWPEALITLHRPSIPEVVSTWSRHNGYVWTYYNLVVDWTDNVAISRMWIQQGDKEIKSVEGKSQKETISLNGLYFTGLQSVEYIFGAEDFNGNTQLEKVTLEIKIPDLTMKGFVPLWTDSGQLVAEISHDIDEWMVIFQRDRNWSWQEIWWTNSNSYGWFSLRPKQTVVTWSVFSLGNTVWLFNSRAQEIVKISVDGHVSVVSGYQNLYSLGLDLDKWSPLIRVLDKVTGNALFWIQMSPYELVSLTLQQNQNMYTQVSLDQMSFGLFYWGYCIQNSQKNCLFYISPEWSVYIPQSSLALLGEGEYSFDEENRLVTYVFRDSATNQILSITLKVRTVQ